MRPMHIRTITLAAAVLVASGPAQAQKELKYKGFVVDITAVASDPAHEAALAGIKIQIDLVDELKIADSVKKFFRSIPLVMKPTTGSAAYGAGRVVIPQHSGVPYDKDHPILLHELCHAYHDKRLPGGFANATIIGMYDQAVKSGAFPAGSYMLSKRAEYFAMMASVYLYGSAARDPFTRDSIKSKQPDMYQWLVKEFGAK